MKEIDKWVLVIGLLGLIACLITLGLAGAEPRSIAKAAGFTGLMGLLYGIGRGVFEQLQ